MVSPTIPGSSHYKTCSVVGTLVVPQWVSEPYWPLLFPDGSHPARFVKEVIVLPSWEPLILPGQSGSSLFNGMPNAEVWALYLDFQYTQDDGAIDQVVVILYQLQR